MSQNKKQVRKKFRDSVFKRDRFCCVICGLEADKFDPEITLDAHHITNRNLIPFGGYVLENGISLCKINNNCHLKAENNIFSANFLYNKINSSYQKALEASNDAGGN